MGVFGAGVVRLRTRYAISAFAALGPSAWLRFKFQRFRARRGSYGGLLELRARSLPYPVYARRRTTDLKVFEAVFAWREYRCLDRVVDPELIVDLGANVGYSTAYFCARYPRAMVIAVEPDPDNVAMLRRNVANDDAVRVRVIPSGVWSHPAWLQLVPETMGPGVEWGRQVRECPPQTPGAMQAVDIATLLAQSGHDRISILKIDIEGAESEVFTNGFERWIDRVDNLVVELHGHAMTGVAAQAFFSAICGRGFDVTTCDELTVCTR